MMKNTCPCGDRSVGNFFVIKRSIDVKLICGDHSVKKPALSQNKEGLFGVATHAPFRALFQHDVLELFWTVAREHTPLPPSGTKHVIHAPGPSP